MGTTVRLYMFCAMNVIIAPLCIHGSHDVQLQLLDFDVQLLLLSQSVVQVTPVVASSVPTIVPMKRIAISATKTNLRDNRMMGIEYQGRSRAMNQLYGVVSIGRRAGEDYYTITAADGTTNSFFITDSNIKLFKLVEQEAGYIPVVVEKYQANALHVGDVVAYKNPSGEEIVYGRIIGRTQNIEYQTADYAVITENQLVAKLTSHMIQRVYR